MTLAFAAALVVAVSLHVTEDSGKGILLFDCTTSARSRDGIEAAGGQRFRWFGQSIDPESERSGTIDVGKLLDEVSRCMRESPFRWGMLDYENPFDSWMDLPADDERHVRAAAETLRALRAVKAAFPGVKWTCYGLPRLDHWPVGPDGSRVGWDGRPSAALVAEIARRMKAYSGIVAELDWIAPSFYDYYENAGMADPVGASMIASERIWRVESVRLARSIRSRLGLPPVPVIPCISPFFQPGGKATVLKVIPTAELVADQLDPSIAAGVDGFAIWTAADYLSRIGTAPTDGLPAGNATKDQQDVRRAWAELAGDGRSPVDWTSDTTRFRLSQGVGQVILDAARLSYEALRRQAAAAATP